MFRIVTILVIFVTGIMGRGNHSVNMEDMEIALRDHLTVGRKAYSVNIDNSNNHNYHINIMAESLGVSYSDLFSLIAFETGHTFDPNITNPFSGARGLIQFTNTTAKTIKGKDGRKLTSADDLIKEYPTVEDQLALPCGGNTDGGPVYQYLIRYHPFKSKRDLFLAVFHPLAINWPDDQILPKKITDINPGIVRVGDYLAMVESHVQFTDTPIYD